MVAKMAAPLSQRSKYNSNGNCPASLIAGRMLLWSHPGMFGVI